MSLEYTVFMAPGENQCFDAVAENIIQNIPEAKISDDSHSLWLPGEYSHWIDFSIEKSDDGFFIVTNMNGSSNKSLFQLIETVLNRLSVGYSIEEV
ncbi:hypothetical protein [Budvicia aquatica]|uniref:Uncharacterized protein n=1 Tax=Budvicia aquatica TaxID=82979 RepID=A0A2C6DMJ5_9GAMM|nr:hypothetical protein [Budvicia aquatica]PHI30437.1 hypothetical protein CRN84_14375 [Budvicia aquatica]VFS49636.1 Uncharacterised protein [Budvicia aquatica]